MAERLSIIMPVLNEEARIATQLAGLAGLSGVTRSSWSTAAVSITRQTWPPPQGATS